MFLGNDNFDSERLPYQGHPALCYCVICIGYVIPGTVCTEHECPVEGTIHPVNDTGEAIDSTGDAVDRAAKNAVW